MSRRTERSVWKFEIEITDAFTIPMPEGAKPLYVAVQDGKPFLWAEVDPTAEPEYRRFFVCGTGHPVPPGVAYLGSFMVYDGRFVGHLYTVPQPMAREMKL